MANIYGGLGCLRWHAPIVQIFGCAQDEALNMQKTSFKLFRSAANEQRFQTSYTSLLEGWDVGYRSVFVDTEFGRTHVISSGDSGSPVVLVPGAQGTAGMWGQVVSKLSTTHKTFSIDLIDQVGRSEPARVLTNSEDSTLWLKQTLDALNLHQVDQVDLVGNSLGSFVSASYACRYPERVRTLTLTAPAATVSNVRLGYIAQVLFSMNLPGGYWKKRFLLKSGAGLVTEEDKLFGVLYAAMQNSNVVSQLIPRYLGRRELAKLQMPVLLILGQKDGVNNESPTEITQKMSGMLPQFNCEVFDDAGHLWAPKHFDQAGQLIETFLRNS